jgi:ethanolamine utilization protein EutN
MKIGKVVSNVWATRKDPALTGVKLMIVEIMETNKKAVASTIVAADLIGAGIGEKVIITEGSSARQMGGFGDAPVDAVIVGIIDEEKENAI